MSVQDWSRWGEDGTEESDPRWPFILEFEPYDVYNWTEAWQEDFSDQFMKIYPGTVLWKVFAYRDPLHKLSGSRGDLIGRVVLISEVTTSLWGDQTLFFKHQRMDDDLKYFPEWQQYLQSWPMGKLDEEGLTLPPPVEKCPFKFIYDMWDKFQEAEPEPEEEVVLDD